METSIIIAPTPIPDFDTAAIDRSPLAAKTKAQYRRALRLMTQAGINPTNYEELQTYSNTLPISGQAFLKSALRLSTLEHEQAIKANAAPQHIAAQQAALWRLEAMRGAIKTSRPKGIRAHVWMSRDQVRDITSIPGEDLRGRRDYIILAVFLGSGLRREELINLQFSDILQQPMRSGQMRTVIEVKHGKGDKSRVVPISQKLTNAINDWRDRVGDGRIARSIARGMLGESISPAGVFTLVKEYGKKIGIDNLQPHDLRRSYAQIGFESGVSITQISTLLGHSNVATTQKYLDLSIDKESTASDYIPLS